MLTGVPMFDAIADGSDDAGGFALEPRSMSEVDRDAVLYNDVDADNSNHEKLVWAAATCFAALRHARRKMAAPARAAAARCRYGGGGYEAAAAASFAAYATAKEGFTVILLNPAVYAQQFAQRGVFVASAERIVLLHADGSPMPGLLVFEITSSKDGKAPVAQLLFDTWDEAAA